MGKKSWMGVGALAICLGLTGTAAANHWNDQNDLADAANELGSEAKQFAKAVKKAAPFSDLNDLAGDLAESAYVLRELTQSGWGPFFIQNTWDEVQSRYHELRQEWKHAHKLNHKPMLKKAWNQLRSAYEDLEWQMNNDWDDDDNDWDDDDDNDWDDDDDNDWDDDDNDPDDDIDIVLL